MPIESLIIVTNLAICLVGLSVCVCRMAQMTQHETKLVIRVQYAIWTGFFVSSAISFTYDAPTTITQTFLSLAVVVHLMLGYNAWRVGAPSYTMQDKGVSVYGD